MIFMDEYEIITAAEQCLTDLKKLICPIQGCGKIICSKSAVRSHLSKIHWEKDERSGNVRSKLYACPIKGCPRNAESARQQFFQDLYSLKMHYRSVHGEKTLKCTKCSKMFGNPVVYAQHKNKCKKLNNCECGVSYNSRNALLMHAKRKQHKIIGLEGFKVSKPVIEPSKSPAVPGILYLPNTQGMVNFKVDNEILSNVESSHNLLEAIQFPRLLRILPNDAKRKDQVVKQKITFIEDKVGLQNSVEIPNNVIAKGNIKATSSMDSCYEFLMKDHSLIHSSLSPTNGNSQHTIVNDIYSCAILPSVETSNILQSSSLLDITPESEHEKTEIKKQPKGYGKPYIQKYLKRMDFKTRLKKNDDVFDEINVSAKNLAHTFTQTSVSLKDIYKDSCSLKKISMDTQTEVDINNFQAKRTTMDIQTQIDFFHHNGRHLKATSNTQTDRSSGDYIPKMSSMDTQTHINSSNFNDIIKKLTMDTQTEINSDNFDNISRKSTVEAQTQMNFNIIGSTTEILETSDPNVKCQMETLSAYSVEKGLENSLFLVADNETQTDPISTWLNSFTCQDLSNMETQTNIPDCDDDIPLLDKSVQLENMIDLSDDCGIISSNISTQTLDVLRDPWLTDNLEFESSSTQTDYFQSLDFTDIDFHLDKGTSLSPNAPGRYCNDVLISGNIPAENIIQVKNNIETQTTISLYDLLDNSLIGNYFNMDKNMTNIETQTADEFPEIFRPQRNNIETQTDLF